MKNYKYLPLIFTLFLTVNTFSQQNVKLDWKEIFNHENSVISFKNATFLHEFNGLASYQKLNRVKSNNTYEISLSDERFKEVSSSEKRLLESLEITEKALIRSEILISKGEFYNRIMVFPYIKKNNQYKKLTSFSFTNKKKSEIKSRKQNGVKTNSVLSTNNWYKISVSENGVYKLTFSNLQSLGI
ncbi:MAG: type IX secretion system sortase PorU, long form, partial [Flavobacteriales bacterium]